MKPLLRLVRNNSGEWEERRFFNSFTIRTVRGTNATAQDIRYLQAHSTFPTVGAVSYMPYVKTLAH